MTLFQYAVVASILHDEKQKRRLLGNFESALEKAGGELQSLGSETLRPRNDTLPLFIFVLTGGTEADAMRLVVQEKMLQRMNLSCCWPTPHRIHCQRPSRFLQN
jgi:hypothetical protein